MEPVLDYARPTARWPSRLLGRVAHLTLAYPLFLVGSLYGEWLLAWCMLGHPPQPSFDDPMSISGSSWMHPMFGIAMVGFIPAGCAALVLNTLYIINNRVRGGRLAARVIFLLVLWLGVFAWLRYDPHAVVEWWFD